MPELGKTVQAGGCTRKLRKHDSAVCSFVEVVNAFVQKAIDLTGVGGLLLAAAGRVSPRQATSFLAARQERRQRNVPYIQRPRQPREAGQSGQPAATTNAGVRPNSLRARALRSDSVRKSEHEVWLLCGSQTAGVCCVRRRWLKGVGRDILNSQQPARIAPLGYFSRWPQCRMGCEIVCSEPSIA